MSRGQTLLGVGLLALTGCGMAVLLTVMADDEPPPRHLDPAAWGDDHAGQPPPAYMTGDECLFCHRQIGATWGGNRHQRTTRPADPDDPAMVALRGLGDGNKLAEETRYLLGSERITRFLKRSDQYGHFELLSTAFIPGRARDDVGEAGALKDAAAPHWDARTFGNRCAGCHASAVNPQTRAFSAVSLDCHACHGDVQLEHTKDVSLVQLSSQCREPRQIVSICGQCHLRGGQSKSSGLPFPSTFVAGDNLFRDFRVDLSDRAIQSRPAIERHIWHSVRDVAVLDRQETHCLACHDVHGQGTRKHQQLADAAICASCHAPTTGNTRLRDDVHPTNRRSVHSTICDY